MAYDLDQFVADSRAALKRDPGPNGREEVRKNLERLLGNKEFVEKYCGEQEITYLRLPPLAWEDRIVRAAAAVIYVSERNLEKVRRRQSPDNSRKLHLIRYGVSEPSVGLINAGGKCPTARNAGGPWEILYSGNMNG